VAEILQSVAREGNPHVRSDAALGALLAEAALRGALLNVRGNAALLEDRELAVTYLTDADLLEKAGCEAAQRAYRMAMGAAEEGRAYAPVEVAEKELLCEDERGQSVQPAQRSP
jgi:formiminotetrahydrofolate cyclodeaminase